MHDSVDRMPALTRLAHSAIAEAIAFADLLDKLEPERRRSPTPCAEWTIDDLAAHVASGAFRDVEAFHRARLGTSSPPGELAIENTDLAEAIRLSVNHLRGALDHAPSRWPIIPMPFGHYPAATALQGLIIEFGVHHNDLAIAAGDVDAPFTLPRSMRCSVSASPTYYCRRHPWQPGRCASRSLRRPRRCRSSGTAVPGPTVSATFQAVPSPAPTTTWPG